MINAQPVILYGGSGTCQSLSRTGFTTQFLCLTGNESLIQQAAHHLASLGNAANQVASPIIVTGEDYRFFGTEQLH